MWSLFAHCGQDLYLKLYFLVFLLNQTRPTELKRLVYGDKISVHVVRQSARRTSILREMLGFLCFVPLSIIAFSSQQCLLSFYLPQWHYFLKAFLVSFSSLFDPK